MEEGTKKAWIVFIVAVIAASPHLAVAAESASHIVCISRNAVPSIPGVSIELDGGRDIGFLTVGGRIEAEVEPGRHSLRIVKALFPPLIQRMNGLPSDFRFAPAIDVEVPPGHDVVYEFSISLTGFFEPPTLDLRPSAIDAERARVSYPLCRPGIAEYWRLPSSYRFFEVAYLPVQELDGGESLDFTPLVIGLGLEHRTKELGFSYGVLLRGMFHLRDGEILAGAGGRLAFPIVGGIEAGVLARLRDIAPSLRSSLELSAFNPYLVPYAGSFTTLPIYASSTLAVLLFTDAFFLWDCEVVDPGDDTMRALYLLFGYPLLVNMRMCAGLRVEL